MNNNLVLIERNGSIHYCTKTVLFSEWLVLIYEVHTSHTSWHQKEPRNRDAVILEKLKLIQDLELDNMPHIFNFKSNRATFPDVISMTAWVCHYLKRGGHEQFVAPFWEQIKENDELRRFDSIHPDFLMYIGDLIVSGGIQEKVSFLDPFY